VARGCWLRMMQRYTCVYATFHICIHIAGVSSRWDEFAACGQGVLIEEYSEVHTHICI